MTNMYWTLQGVKICLQGQYIAIIPLGFHSKMTGKYQSSSHPLPVSKNKMCCLLRCDFLLHNHKPVMESFKGLSNDQHVWPIVMDLSQLGLN
jgi:hypothetical protein